MNTPRIPTLTLTLLLGAGILGVGALRGDQATTRPDAASTPVSATTPLEYKVISGFKQPFILILPPDGNPAAASR